MSFVVNLLGAPGAGKSTTRAGVFHHLKRAGLNVEEVTEFAKDLTWEGRSFALGCQPYVFAKQLRNVERVLPQVQAVITDSPIILSAFYARKYGSNRYPASFERFVRDQFDAMPGINFYLRRTKPYNPAGRNQTADESDAIGDELLDMLREMEIPFVGLDGDENAVSTICARVIDKIECR